MKLVETNPKMLDELEFQYASECDFETHCSPFGLSGIFLKLRGTNLIGIGSTMGLITGTTEGHIYYNDKLDLANQKYKLFVVVTEDGNLRIDFTKIHSQKKDVAETDLKKAVADSDLPSVVFMGKCPEGRPDNIEPFIGIFSFEKDE